MSTATEAPRAEIRARATTGWSSALSLYEAGVAVTALADEHASIRLDSGLDVPRRCPAHPRGRPRAGRLRGRGERGGGGGAPGARGGIGANDGLFPEVEGLLYRRQVPVVPDFVGGAGGSASMDALFAPAGHPEPATVLEQAGEVVARLTRRLLATSDGEGVAPREAALALADATRLAPGSKPYALRTLSRARDPASTPPAGWTARSGAERRCTHERGHIEAAVRVAELGGGHPQRTMLLAWHLWDLTGEQGRATLDTVTAALDSVLTDVGPELEAVWRGLAGNERRLAVALAAGLAPLGPRARRATGMASASAAQRALEGLLAAGHAEREPKPTLVDPLFALWLRSRHEVGG